MTRVPGRLDRERWWRPGLVARTPLGFGLALFGLALFGHPLPASGHEVRPAYLAIVEGAPGHFEVVWKQPVVEDRRLRIEPRLPEACVIVDRDLSEVTDGALIERFRLDCRGADGRRSLEGETLAIDGLARTLTDVLVRVRFADGEELSRLLTPRAPEMVVARGGGSSAWAYLRLGVEHLLLGFDHILFVIGLMFLVSRRLELLGVVTSFTVAHSLTLAGSTLGLVRLRQAPVEAVIALTILYLAIELLGVPGLRGEGVEKSTGDRRVESGVEVTRRRPWRIAFAFGLLHGFGFAGALAEIGLPKNAVAPALLLFNLGVEVGQLMVVAAILGALWLVRLAAVEIPRWAARAPIYAMGLVASYWFVERVARVIGVA